MCKYFVSVLFKVLDCTKISLSIEHFKGKPMLHPQPPTPFEGYNLDKTLDGLLLYHAATELQKGPPNLINTLLFVQLIKLAAQVHAPQKDKEA